MLEQPIFAASPTDVRALISARCWATLVTTSAATGPVISHLPIIVDRVAGDAAPGPELTVLGHLALEDALLHQLGDREVALIVEGANGYISPTLYQAGPYVPTWNFVVAHLYGRPEPLGPEETFDVLDRTVDHLEAGYPRPWRLASVDAYARSIAPYAIGFRLTPARVVGKAKLSQDKPPEVVERVIGRLTDDPDYRNPELAAAMHSTFTPSGKGR
jgi:transcriptional regulator